MLYIYTISQIKRSHFCDNFCKCGPISIILSLLISCRRGTCKWFHITSYLLPHCFVKFECLVWMFDCVPCRKWFHIKNNVKSLLYSEYSCYFFVHVFDEFILYFQSVCPCKCKPFMPLVNAWQSVMHCSMCTKRSFTMAQNIAVMSNDVSRTWKKIN